LPRAGGNEKSGIKPPHSRETPRDTMKPLLCLRVFYG
jgi:hypothetical protein